MKYFLFCSLLIIYMAGTCLRPVACQSSGATGGGFGSANNGGSSHSSVSNENQGSGTVGGIGHVLGSVNLSSRSTGTSDTSGYNNAQGGGSGSAHAN